VYVNNCKILLATGEELKMPMKKNRSNYARISKMGIQILHLPNGGTYQALYRKNLPEEKGSIILPMRRMFPAIYAAHQQVGHMKIVSSYKNLSRIVYNHDTQEQNKIFIETCPACIERATVIKPFKGAAVAIRSVKFRDRMQVDLIDFRKHAKKDTMGNLMRYIINIKDHFTGFTIIDCIPRKRARCVAFCSY
jgi:hypothetical protein